MELLRPTTIDFETYGIESRPDYPPAPVGVAIKEHNKPGKYYSFGHSQGNNCTRNEAHAALSKVYKSGSCLLFHNAKFDLDVAETHFHLPLPHWEKVHDSMFLLFLHDPHARELGLKPAARKILGIEPEEQDAVKDWLINHQPVENVRITKTNFGKYIAYAPGNIVGDYALGDVERTEYLFDRLYPSIADRGMLGAYRRERRLVPILLAMERQGLRVDITRLRSDVTTYSAVLSRLEKWICNKIGVPADFNLGSSQKLAKALFAAGLADENLMGRTAPSKTYPSGQVKMDKTALSVGVSDPQLASVLQYTSQLGTCLNTFMKPWLVTADKSGGYIYTNWNQTRGELGGARTGRFSSSNTNLQNIPKEFSQIFWERVGDNYPKPPFKVPPLPLCRSYIVPYNKGDVLISKDFSQQEVRILAHFEDGELLRQYQENPWLDMHDNAKTLLENLYHRVFKRGPVKNINLGLIYGQGISSLAVRNGESYESTKQLYDSILRMYPGLKAMRNDMKYRARTNQPIRTWGGREYFCESAIIYNGKRITFEYKMVNVLVQGSAADCTKEGLIRMADRIDRQYHNRGWLLISQVHDEIVMSVPEVDLHEAQEALREEMESVEFDVKILTEGAFSKDNWNAMIEYDKKGKKVY